MTALVELRGFTVRFGAAVAVDGVSLALHPGRTLALVGKSGSGKSLTALGIAGLSPAAARLSGSLRIGGRELLGAPERDWRAHLLRQLPLRGGRIGVVFQEALGSLNPAMRIGDQIGKTIRAHRALGRVAVAARVLAALEEVGFPDPPGKAAAFPHQLSGGQQQRAMIAMALAADPDLLIADEPTTALDTTVQAQILALLAELQARRGLAMLIVAGRRRRRSHDLAAVAGTAHEVAVMRAGRIVEAGPTARVFVAPAHPYTAALLASRPQARPATPGPTTGPAALDVRDLAVTFSPHRRGGLGVRAVGGVSLTLAPGAALGLVGESGSGKSTLARAAVGLVRPDAGSLRVFGLDHAGAGRRPVVAGGSKAMARRGACRWCSRTRPAA